MPRVKLYDYQRHSDPDAAIRDPVERDRRAEALAIREEHRARELEVASARELQQLQDTVRSTRGFAAEQAMTDAQTRVEAMRREVLTGAESATMRQMLADVFNQRADVARHEMEVHVEREKFASRLDISAQRQALAQDDAVRSVTPLGFQANVQTAFDEIDVQGMLMRRDAASIAAEKARLLNELHELRAQRPAVDEASTDSGEVPQGDFATRDESTPVPAVLWRDVPEGASTWDRSATAPATAADAAPGEAEYVLTSANPGPSGQGLGPSPQQQATAAAHAAGKWAYEQKGSTAYQKSDYSTQVGGHSWWWTWGKGAAKCNIFVYDALRKAGIAPRTVNGESRPPVVKDWRDRNSTIDGFRPLAADAAGKQLEPIQIGDIVANKGHVGIIVGLPYAGRTKPLVASAAVPTLGDQITLTEFGFRAKDVFKDVVIWRRVDPPPVVETPGLRRKYRLN